MKLITLAALAIASKASDSSEIARKSTDIKRQHQERIWLEGKLARQEGELKMHELHAKLRGRELKMELHNTESELYTLKRNISGHKVRDVILKLILPIVLVAILSGVVIFFCRKSNKVVLAILAADVISVIVISITYHYLKA